MALTKADELKIIQDFTMGLPQNSYLRPWLIDVMPQIISEIHSDFPVSPSIKDTRRECLRMIEQAQAEAKRIREQADKVATDLIKQAQRQRDDVLRVGLHALNKAKADLEAYL